MFHVNLSYRDGVTSLGSPQSATWMCRFLHIWHLGLTLFHAAVYGMRTMQHEGRKAQTKLGFLDLCRLSRIALLTAVGQWQKLLLYNLLYGHVNCHGKLLPHTLPPPDILCCYTEPRQNRVRYLHSHSILGVKTLFYKKFIKGFRKSLDKAFKTLFKFKIIFSNNKVTAVSKSVKPGKIKKTYFLRRVITWSKMSNFN